jgi:hypothetical protein
VTVCRKIGPTGNGAGCGMGYPLERISPNL